MPELNIPDDDWEYFEFSDYSEIFGDMQAGGDLMNKYRADVDIEALAVPKDLEEALVAFMRYMILCPLMTNDKLTPEKRKAYIEPLRHIMGAELRLVWECGRAFEAKRQQRLLQMN